MSEDRSQLRAEAAEQVMSAASKLTHAEWSRIAQAVGIAFQVKATKRTLDSNDLKNLKQNLSRLW